MDLDLDEFEIDPPSPSPEPERERKRKPRGKSGSPKLWQEVERAITAGASWEDAAKASGMTVAGIKTRAKREKWCTSILRERERIRRERERERAKRERTGGERESVEGEGVGKTVEGEGGRHEMQGRDERGGVSDQILRPRASEIIASSLAEIGERNAVLVAERSASLISEALAADLVAPPASWSDLSTAVRIVERVTGRDRPQVAVQVNTFQAGLWQ